MSLGRTSRVDPHDPQVPTLRTMAAVPPPETDPADGPARGETCDYCGSSALTWRKCKLICDDCRQINKSCADL